MIQDAVSKARIDRESSWLYVAAGAVIGGVAGVVYYAFSSKLQEEEDRPPIIVRGGSVNLEMHPRKGKSQSPEWEDDGANQHWKPKHPLGESVDEFLVAVIDPDSSACEGLRGSTVQIMHSGSGGPIVFVIANGEPKVRPKDQFTANNQPPLKTLKKSDGQPTQVRVGNRTCELDANSEVWIWPVKSSLNFI